MRFLAVILISSLLTASTGCITFETAEIKGTIIGTGKIEKCTDEYDTLVCTRAESTGGSSGFYGFLGGLVAAIGTKLAF